jgi:hypothetical protein
MSYFISDQEANWDRHIKMQNVLGQLDRMELLESIPCGDEVIGPGFQWDGASVGPLRKLPIIGFPKWKHPIATCRHDMRCNEAVTKEERRFADKRFYRDVGRGGTWWERAKGYIGVRLGSYWWAIKGQLKKMG